MFMVRDEYINARKLLKVKIKITAKSFRLFLIISGMMFISRLGSTIYSVLQDNNNVVMPHTMSDFSNSLFVGMVIAHFIFMITYRQINNYLSVLPQTNNSRFIATQLFTCIFTIFIGVTALVIYLTDYSILKLISLYKNNIHFALNFDIGFVITGFITFMIYSFLIISVLGFIGAVLRKWRYYAVAALIVVLSLMIANLKWVTENLPKIFAFIINEPVPIWFILKGTALWIIITAVSLVINCYTVYYKSSGKPTVAGIAIVCVVAAVIIMIVPAFLLFNVNTAGGELTLTEEAHTQPATDYYAEFTEIRIDISHLPKGSNLKVESEKVALPELDIAYQAGKHEFIAFGTDSLNNMQGDVLIISYRMPRRQVNGIELYAYTNPNLTAYLNGDTLNIDCTFENAHVIILPVWSIAGQFDYYKDKGVLPKIPWGYSSSGGSEGNINIRVE